MAAVCAKRGGGGGSRARCGCGFGRPWRTFGCVSRTPVGRGVCEGIVKGMAYRGDDARGVERLVVLLDLSEVLTQPVEHEKVGFPQFVERHLLVRRKGRYEEEFCEGVCAEVLAGGGR